MPKAMPTFSSLSKTRGLMEGTLPIMGTMLIDSVPPAMTTSASPTRIRSAAMASAVRPEAQKRFTVTPPTVLGKPGQEQDHARHVPALLGFGNGASDDDVFDSFGSSFGTWAMAERMAWTSRSSGRVFLNAPRGALPIGVRMAEAM